MLFSIFLSPDCGGWCARAVMVAFGWPFSLHDSLHLFVPCDMCGCVILTRFVGVGVVALFESLAPGWMAVSGPSQKGF